MLDRTEIDRINNIGMRKRKADQETIATEEKTKMRADLDKMRVWFHLAAGLATSLAVVLTFYMTCHYF